MKWHKNHLFDVVSYSHIKEALNIYSLYIQLIGFEYNSKYTSSSNHVGCIHMHMLTHLWFALQFDAFHLKNLKKIIQ